MKQITINTKTTIHQAMKRLNQIEGNSLIIVNKKGKLLGTLTDGDLRRSILSGSEFSELITNIYNSNPIFLIQDKFNKTKVKQLLLQYGIDLIPIVNSSHVVCDYMNWSKMGSVKTTKNSVIKNVPIVIMAGGKGTRLDPFTKILPKPLLPINGKPVIEHIIDKFSHFGCDDFYIMVNYKSKIISAYFADKQTKYRTNIIKEDSPLGTAGGLSLLNKKFDRPFFVINCDTIINSNYVNLYQFHHDNNNDITLIASTKEHVIPYGICELNENGQLLRINEKPQLDLLINTGLYIMNPNVLALVPKNRVYHFNELIQEAKRLGMNVGVFPIDNDSWNDVGQWTEFRNTVKGM